MADQYKHAEYLWIFTSYFLSIFHFPHFHFISTVYRLWSIAHVPRYASTLDDCTAIVFTQMECDLPNLFLLPNDLRFRILISQIFVRWILNDASSWIEFSKFIFFLFLQHHRQMCSLMDQTIYRHCDFITSMATIFAYHATVRWRNGTRVSTRASHSAIDRWKWTNVFS